MNRYDSDEPEMEASPSILNPLTPEIVQAAQAIYQTYYDAHGDAAMAPLGVVVDRQSLRGQLIFTGQPILLPHECFIPLEQLAYYDADYDTDSESSDYWES